MPVLERTFEFELPAALEAHEPPEARGLRRDGVRLLVTERQTGRLDHDHFRDLPDFLSPGDLVVANESGTLPAELTARQSDGTSLPLRLSTQLEEGIWTVEPRGIQPASGERLSLPDGGEATLFAPYRGSARLWVAEVILPGPAIDYLLRWGRPIRYSYVPKEWPLEYYQTVYHGGLGSAEMASAGRPFTPEVLAGLQYRGVGFRTLTLHTGVSSVESHEPPYPEWYRVPEETVEAVTRTRAEGGRVVAVGTTVVRALESAARGGELRADEGWTDLVITPERGVRVVNALLTGFHEPRASHLAMLEAIAGRPHLAAAYRAALDEGYLWHEFGDVHLILP